MNIEKRQSLVDQRWVGMGELICYTETNPLLGSLNVYEGVLCCNFILLLIVLTIRNR